MRNLKSAAWTAAKFSGHAAGLGAAGLIRWASTDHTGFGKALDKMPSMGVRDSISSIFSMFIASMVVVVIQVVVFLFTFFVWIPFLFRLIFS
jgi:hypothetical protein